MCTAPRSATRVIDESLFVERIKGAPPTVTRIGQHFGYLFALNFIQQTIA
jgi:hypothetical protein